MNTKRVAAALLLGLALAGTGCGSVGARAFGVQKDVLIYSGVAADGFVAVHGFPLGTAWAAVDLPLSFAVDTALAPFELGYHVAHGMR
jgi:uncharacterized protein YceK